MLNRVIWQDAFKAIDLLPDKCVDLVVTDPPYNLTKNFGSSTFREMKNDEYLSWGFRNKLPFVNLSCSKEQGIFTLEPFYIKDLVAYNYIANADDYIERGYEAIYIDGNPKNNNYQNIMYVPTRFE